MGAYEYGVISMNEGFYEQVIIDYLVDRLGYSFLHGPDVERTTGEYLDVYLPEELPRSLRRVNPGLPQQAITEAILRLDNLENGPLEQRNETYSEKRCPSSADKLS